MFNTFDTSHIAIGIRKNGTVNFLAAEDDMEKQIAFERAAVSSGDFERVIRVNADGSVFELTVDKEPLYTFTKLSDIA